MLFESGRQCNVMSLLKNFSRRLTQSVTADDPILFANHVFLQPDDCTVPLPSYESLDSKASTVLGCLRLFCMSCFLALGVLLCTHGF